LVEVKSFDEYEQQLMHKLNRLNQDAERAAEGERTIERLRDEIESDSNKLGELNPRIETFKNEIKEIEAKILESGGPEYKR
jgi:uncharacterized coiled-coil DUF342 family protein